MQLTKKYNILMWLCCLAYCISYVGRLAYNTNIQNVIDTFSVDKGVAGVVTSVFFVCYGSGQIINAILCEKLDSYKTVFLSIMVSSLITVAMYFVSSVLVMSILWGLNGLVLASLWCNLVKILTIVKDQKSTSKAVIVLAVSLPLGTLVAYGVSALLTYLGAWQVYYLFSAVVLLAGGVIFFILATKTQKEIVAIHNQMGIIEPSSSLTGSTPSNSPCACVSPVVTNEPCTCSTPDLTPLEAPKQVVSKPLSENLDQSVANSTLEPIKKQSFFKFLSFAIIPFLLIAITTNIVKDGLITWFSPFLKENFNMPTYFTILTTLCLPLVGVLSSFVGTFVMNKLGAIFKAMGIYWFICTVLVSVLCFVMGVPLVMVIIIFAVLNLVSHSTNGVLTSIFPLYYKKYFSSGRVSGLTNAFCYIGSAISSFALGMLADSYGWQVFMYVMLGVCAFSLILSIIGELLFKKHNLK